MFLVMSLFVLLPACSKRSSDQQVPPAASKTLYHCAMHPKIISDKPGECPICHMTLSPVETGLEPAPTAPHKLLYYRNPMNPSATSPVPMKDSMGMDYIPVYSDDVQGKTTVPGQATIHLSEGVEQRVGVQVTEAQVRNLVLPVRAAARVAYDPQLYSAALEHQEAVKFLAQARKEGGSNMDQAEATVHSSQLRLQQMGLSNDQIELISQPGYDPSSLLVGSKSGRVWVYVDVFDNQAAAVKPGQSVELTSTALPGKVFTGTVRAIDPIVNPESRTVRVRVSASSPGGELRPGIYVSAVIHAALGRALAIPDSAVVDTGSRQLVYVQTAPGTYEPRQVRVGRQAEGYAEILEGLKPGEKVVSSANFLIDSESRIQGAAQEATK